MPADLQSETIIHETNTSPTSLIGRTLNGRYLVEQELKRGGFGIVYLALDKQLHSRPVVVKVLLDDAYQQEYIVQKFRQEVEALSRIDHPGVVGIIDSGELGDGKPFIVMQYVDGLTLRSVMKPEGMDLERAADLIRQIGRALTAAHDKGILHRDLKPENVMLQNLGHGEEQVKIIDFGIAKIKDSVVAPNTATNVAAGTVAYMAPEQLSGRAVSAATDVYALGQIAYEMLTGRKPFNPETGFELLEMQRAGVRIMPADLRPILTRAAQQSILKALSFDPDNRYSHARTFGDELSHALTSTEINSGDMPPEIGDPTLTRPASQEVSLGQKLDPRSEKTIPVSFAGLQPSNLAMANSAQDSADPARRRWPIVLLVLIVLIGGSLGAWYLVTKKKIADPPPISSSVSRNLSYSLTVQKMRDRRPYQDQFESSGQEIFENGWKFRMNLSSPESGYLYLLNEGPSADGNTTFNLLFPSPTVNSGASYVATNQSITTDWMFFDENQGTEHFWVVWSATSVPELEAVKGVVNEIDRGTINDAGQARSVRDFLLAGYSSSQPEIAKEKTKKQTNVKASGNLLVNKIELEHH